MYNVILLLNVVHCRKCRILYCKNSLLTDTSILCIINSSKYFSSKFYPALFSEHFPTILLFYYALQNDTIFNITFKRHQYEN